MRGRNRQAAPRASEPRMNVAPLLLAALAAASLLALPPAAASPVVVCVPDGAFQACAYDNLPYGACAWVKKGATTYAGQCVSPGALP